MLLRFRSENEVRKSGLLVPEELFLIDELNLISMLFSMIAAKPFFCFSFKKYLLFLDARCYLFLEGTFHVLKTKRILQEYWSFS